jgi:hypothetical protein
MRKLFNGAAFVGALILGCSIFTGCVAVPSTEIVFAGIKAKFPKDTSAASLDITVKRGADTLTFRATNWSTANNPAVIGASTEMIKAHYDGTAGLLREGISAAVKSAAPIP